MNFLKNSEKKVKVFNRFSKRILLKKRKFWKKYEKKNHKISKFYDFFP